MTVGLTSGRDTLFNSASLPAPQEKSEHTVVADTVVLNAMPWALDCDWELWPSKLDTIDVLASCF